MYWSCAYDSTEAAKRVPTHAPSAPSSSVLASASPSAMPPAPSTRRGPTASATRGMSWARGVTTPSKTPRWWPPASPPWAMKTSTPTSSAASAPVTEATCIHTLAPAAWSFSTHACVGGPQKNTTMGTCSSTSTSMCASVTKVPSLTEIDAEEPGRHPLDLLHELLEHRRWLHGRAEHAQRARVGDGRHQLRQRVEAHAGADDRVAQAVLVGQPRAQAALAPSSGAAVGARRPREERGAPAPQELQDPPSMHRFHGILPPPGSFRGGRVGGRVRARGDRVSCR